jgi:hypothetical protein
VPCRPLSGPAETSPRREEVTTQHEAREGKNPQVAAKITCNIRASRSGKHGAKAVTSGQSPAPASSRDSSSATPLRTGADERR